MSAPQTIRMTLTGCFEGKTKKLNGIKFKDGACLFTGSEAEVMGITKYFTRCYSVDVEEVTAKSLKDEAAAAAKAAADAKHQATRVDDSDVISEKELEEQKLKEQEKEEHPEPEEPNKRQQDIIAAVNGIEKSEWVDQQAKTPRPRVKDVQVLMEDPTVKANEIVEVIEKWLS